MGKLKENCLVGIYCWKNKITNRIYIGSSKNLNDRFYEHLFNKNSNTSLQKDIQKYGIENFQHTIIEFININLITTPIEKIKKIIIEREQYYLDLYCKAKEDNNLFFRISYNKNRKAESPLGLKWSEESRKKASDWQKGRKLPKEHVENIVKGRKKLMESEGYINPTKGRKQSEKHRKSIMEATKHLKKGVLKYSLEGCFIDKYESQSEASLSVGKEKGHSSIGRCMKGDLHTAFGFIWLPYMPNEEILLKLPLNKPPKIKVYDANMNYLGTFNNSFHIEKSLRINHTVVNRALKTNSGRSSKYYFEYEN